MSQSRADAQAQADMEYNREPAVATGEAHGIAGGKYANGPDQEYKAVLECTCGFETSRSETWEEAGRELDDHFHEVDGGRE